MRNRSRLLMLVAPWLGGLGQHAGAQPNINVPGGAGGREEIGEVQVGAGTQGDVTTGSSGTKAQKRDAGEGRGKATDRAARPRTADRAPPPGDRTTNAEAARAPSRASDTTKAAR